MKTRYTFRLWQQQISSIPKRKLFLAIRDDVYDAIFAQPEGEFVRADGDIHLLVFNADREEVVKWISWDNIVRSLKQN